MDTGRATRLPDCPACGRPAAVEGQSCIFCGTTLVVRAVAAWRPVYHAYSYTDGWLATTALISHGLTARMSGQSADRALTGAQHGVVQVADGQHLEAQEVLRLIRGVRTDTEYVEWQALKHRRRVRRGLIVGVLAALAAAVAFMALLADAPRKTHPSARRAR